MAEEYYDEEGYYDEELDEEELEEEFLPEEKPWWMHWALPFLASVGVHLLFVVMALCIVFLVSEGENKAAVRLHEQEIIKQQYDEEAQRDIEKTPKVIAEKFVERPIIMLDEEKPPTKDVPRGTSFDNLSNKNLDSTGYVDAYGIGGGRAGAYGARWGQGSLVREGGSLGTESAVVAALRWLWRHQNRKRDAEAGGWDMDNYMRWCDSKKGGPCPNNNPFHPGSAKDFDEAVTALALLAFLGHGNTHRVGDFRTTVKMALDYLLSRQDGQGWIGRKESVDEWVYNHALSAMALCEAYAMSQDPWLDEPCRRAVSCIIDAQNPGAGWRYTPRKGDNDTSVTGWMVLALKGAKNAGIEVPKSTWEGAIAWFDRCFDPTSGRVGYQHRGDYGSVMQGINENYEKLPTMTSVAVICRIFCGQSRNDPKVKRSVELVMKNLPTWDSKGLKVDMYYWYYATYAMFQYGGTKWGEWNKAMKKVLIETQKRRGCIDGSWDPVGKWGMVGGRVYATAINALTLEIYYRYIRYKRRKGLKQIRRKSLIDD